LKSFREAWNQKAFEEKTAAREAKRQEEQDPLTPARNAWESGRSLYIHQHGRPVAGIVGYERMAEEIEAVEAIGWRLEHFGVGFVDMSLSPNHEFCVFVFRRGNEQNSSQSGGR
jgi:hypothetical protein